MQSPWPVFFLVTNSSDSLHSMDCSPPGSSVHGIFQARILEWVAISSSKGSSWPRDWTHVSCISCTGRQVLYHERRLGSPSNILGDSSEIETFLKWRHESTRPGLFLVMLAHSNPQTWNLKKWQLQKLYPKRMALPVGSEEPRCKLDQWIGHLHSDP